MSSTGSVTASGLLATVLFAPAAYGDGVCERGMRDTTATERQTMTRVLEATLAALPPAPTGWVITGYEGISVPQSYCLDSEGTPWVTNISRTYNRVDDAAQLEETRAAASAALRASQAERQPRIDALTEKSLAFSAELGGAAQRGDQARIDAINLEIAEIQKQMQAIFDEGPSTEQLAALGALEMQDRIMTISVEVNPGYVSHDDMQSATAPTGAQAAFRKQTTDELVAEASTLVLLGGWRPRAQSGSELVRRGSVSSAAAHGMAVTVRSDPARIDGMLAAIDFGALAALLH